MILTTHALTGAVIGKNIDSPAIIIVVSLAVHFLMDSLRHGEYFDSRVAKITNTWWKIALDVAIGFFLIVSAFYFNLEYINSMIIINILCGIFFSLLPDGMSLLFFIFRWKWLFKIKAFHSWAHRYHRYPKFSPQRQWNFRNAINDIIISAIALSLIMFF